MTTELERTRRPMAARRRVALVAVTGAVVGALVAGCGSGPSQAGAAAIVGGTAVPLDYVQTQLASVMRTADQSNPGQQLQLDKVTRTIVQLQVWHELVQRAAQREGVTADEGMLTQLIDQAGGPDKAAQSSGEDPATFREHARDQLLLLELGRKYVSRLSVRFDYTQATSRQDAVAKANALAAHPDQAQRIVEDGVRAGVAGGMGQQLTAAQSPTVALPLFGVSPGTVVAFPPQGNPSQWVVALVRDRHVDPATPASTAAGQQADPQLLEQFGLFLLSPFAQELGVRVNPRYGVWDQVGMTIAPTGQDVQGFEVPVGSAAA